MWFRQRIKVFTKSVNISCILEARIMYHTILKSGEKMEVFWVNINWICSNLIQMEQNGPMTKNSYFSKILAEMGFLGETELWKNFRNFSLK